MSSNSAPHLKRASFFAAACTLGFALPTNAQELVPTRTVISGLPTVGGFKLEDMAERETFDAIIDPGMATPIKDAASSDPAETGFHHRRRQTKGKGRRRPAEGRETAFT